MPRLSLNPTLALAIALALPGVGLAHQKSGHASTGSANAEGSHAAHSETREQGAHEHGAARLDVALSGGTLELQIEGAAFNFVGFERAPEGAEEVARVEQARLLLNNASALFGWETAAGCSSQSSRIDATLPEAGAEKAHDHGHEHKHKHDHDRAHGDHDAKHAEHDHDGHDDSHGAHSNWRSYHRFSCSRPDALGAIEVRLFQHFPELKRLDFQLVTDTTQSGGRLEPGQSVIRLNP